jgi:glycosyltransferase involved in cell wall biosynthesis
MGWLVPNGDSSAFGRVLAEALRNPEESLRRAAEAKSRLGERYSTERWVERTRAVYHAAGMK